MFLIALRNLFQEKNRLLISVGGVAFAIILMVSLFAIYNGSIDRDLTFVQKSPADIFIMRQGMTDMRHGVPLVSLTALNKLAQEPNIKKVMPVISLRPAVRKGDAQYTLFISSFDPADADQGPWAISSGTKQIGDGEILLPTTLAKKLGKQVGDIITFSESPKEWRIGGLVPGASSFGNDYSWITNQAAQSFVTVPGTVSFGYVQLIDPNAADAVAHTLQTKYPDISVRTKQQLVDEGRADLNDSFLPILKAILAIAVLIGTAVIGLTIYTATLDKSREVGILKAIGVTNRQLYTTVLVQALLTTVLGLIVGIVLSYGVGYLIVHLLDLPYLVTTRALELVVGLALGMGMLASFVPVKRLVAIDPAEVFKS